MSRFCKKNKKKTCSVDIETLTLVCRPFYLPREFSSIILTVVYIPQANTDAAVVTQVEFSQPDSFVIVTGGFNKANPKKEMPKFIQQVTCATRDGRTLDHCYTTIKGAYRSIPRAPLGRSDHAMVYLVPTYKQQLKRVKPTVKTVKQWSMNATETLRGCFECSDWGVFKEAAADIVSLNRLSVGCGTTPRRQSGDICRLLFGIRVIYKMLPPHGHCRNIFFYKQLQICISIYFGLI